MSPFLFAHIISGIVSVGICGVALQKIITKKSIQHIQYVKHIGASSAVSVLTGLLLFVLQPGGSLLSFCVRIGFYLAVVCVTQGILIIKSREENSPALRTDSYRE